MWENIYEMFAYVNRMSSLSRRWIAKD